MNDFRNYLKSTEQTLRSFAERIGISQSYLSELSDGKKTPSLQVAHDISVATGGVIGVTYWLNLAPKLSGQDCDVSQTAI